MHKSDFIPQFSLILPCYNEMEVFEESVRRITWMLKKSGYRWEILFVDDGSTDGTRDSIRNFCLKDSRFRFFFHKKNLGRGAAVTTGLKSARAPISGYMDIDCEVDPHYIPRMIRLIQSKHSDIVIGKRVYQVEIGSLVRFLASVGYRFLVRTLFAVGLLDTESGYKVFRTSMFFPIAKQSKSQTWFWDTETIVLSKRAGLRIAQVPVRFVRRTDKHSTVRLIPDILEYLKNIVQFTLHS